MKKKNIFITGGAQGIGKIISKNLLNNGFFVSIVDIDSEAINELKEEIHSEKILALVTDITIETEVKKAVEKSIKFFGKIDALINNAMVQIDKPISQLTLEEWNKVLAVNLTGSFLCSKYIESQLRKNKGVIINICSTRALQSEANSEAYSASKGGLLSLTHALAMSLAPDVRVNAISPGWIDVSAIKKKSKAHQIELSEIDHLQHPAGRVGKAEDIASMVLFLLDQRNDFITGQNFIIDGGMTKKMIYQ